jgi:hypothetical protein
VRALTPVPIWARESGRAARRERVAARPVRYGVPRGSPFTTNVWTLTLTGPNTLDFYNQREYVAPGDTRSTQIETGTLTR